MASHTRTASTDMSAFVKANSKALLGSKFWDTRLVCRVDVGSRPDKLDARTLVLSKFRVFLLTGKSSHNLKIDKTFHLLSIRAIEVASGSELRLAFDDHVNGRRPLLLRAAETSINAQKLAEHLLKALKHYFPGCTDSLRYFMELNPAQLFADFAALPPARPSLPCQSFRRSYAALCDFYEQPFRDEVVWDIEKIYASHSTTSLRLEDFTHLFPKDLIPIVAVLQYSNWFSGLVVDGIKLAPELIDVILAAVRRSQWLKRIVLRNCGLQKEFIYSLAQSFAVNPALPLQTIDLSKNVFDDKKPVHYLGTVLARMSHAPEEVLFADCALSDKAANGLANGLFLCQLSHSALRKLSFAGNLLKEDVNEVYNLLSHCRNVEELDLSQTGLPLDKLWNALKFGGLTLKTLQLSGCHFAARKAKDLSSTPPGLKEFFSSVVALKHISFADTPLPADVLKAVLLGLACNQQVSGIHLNLSATCDRNGPTVLETSLPAVCAVESLILRDNNFDQDLTTLLPALGRMKNLRKLDIGGNNFQMLRRHGHKQSGTITSILVELVKIISEEDTEIREIVLSDCKLGAHLSVLLNALGVASTLRSLDISGNEIGNFGARLMAKALQINSSLETLHIDRNQIGSDGFWDLANALKENVTLTSLPYPLIDATESLARGDRVRTQTALTKVETCLFRNRGLHRPEMNDSDDSEVAYDSVQKQQTHYRLAMGSLDDELNKAVYTVQKSLAETILDENSVEVDNGRALLEDAERAKELLSGLFSLQTDGDFVERLANDFADQTKRRMEAKLAEVAKQLEDYPSSKGFHVCSNPEFDRELKECAGRKLDIDIDSALSDVRLGLNHSFAAARAALAHSVAEKMIQEILGQLTVVARTLSRGARSSSQTGSTNSITMVSSSSPSNTTPKTRRRQKIDRNGRPKSIVQGYGTPNESGMSANDEDNSASAMEGGDLNGSNWHSIDDGDGASFDKPPEPSSLQHLNKERPRPRRNNKTRPMHSQASTDMEERVSVDEPSSPAPELPPPRSFSPTKAPLLPPPRNRNKSAEGNDKNEKTIVADPVPTPSPRSTAPPVGGVNVLTPGFLSERSLRPTKDYLNSPLPMQVPPNTPEVPSDAGNNRKPPNAAVISAELAKSGAKSPMGGGVADASNNAVEKDAEGGWVVVGPGGDAKESVDQRVGANSIDASEMAVSATTDRNSSSTNGSSLATSSTTDSSPSMETSVGNGSLSTADAVSSPTAPPLPAKRIGQPRAPPGLPPKPGTPRETSANGTESGPESPAALRPGVRLRQADGSDGGRAISQLVSSKTSDELNNRSGSEQQEVGGVRRSVVDMARLFNTSTASPPPPQPAPRRTNKIAPRD